MSHLIRSVGKSQRFVLPDTQIPKEIFPRGLAQYLYNNSGDLSLGGSCPALENIARGISLGMKGLLSIATPKGKYLKSRNYGGLEDGYSRKKERL
ncbi:hypothetical protein RUM44_000704 [Polyplax serrata]|uniref:Uncharacterized protein n=1 Tax=Polyplax serrata TaxID=468196 RepID=A0ABR1B634_POLSC